jgi:hypothetical protein
MAEQQKQNAKNEVIGLTREDLLAIIAEIRKPVKTEKEIRDEQQQAIDRAAMAEALKRAEDYRKHVKKTCKHKRSNGTTTAVYITDLNKLYCQACADWIGTDRPELFDELYQLEI